MRPDRLKKALSETVPLANTTSDLWNTIRERIDPTRISVVAPKRRTAVTNERIVISLELKGPISNPRKLWIRTGEYSNIAKSFDGKHYDADEPIMINAPGRYDLEVELPRSFRLQQGEKQICLWLDAWEKGCHTLVWAGPPAPAKPKRLHAVIVGISDYNDRKLNLGSPDSDAIDLTNLFLNDYKTCVLEERSTVEPDFTTAEFDLLVATASPGKKAELNNLASYPFVKVHDANTSNFLAVLDRLVWEAGSDTEHEHRYLLFFAGHGFVDIREGSNRSAFLFPTPRAASPGSRSIYDRSVYGQAIMDRLEKLSGEKIVIFDACRTPVDSNENARFDPGRLEHELAARAISATLLFGSKAGQVAREQKTFVLKQRSGEDLGNGLFTYALVKALTSPEADTSRDTFGSGRIELLEVEQFLNYFFDPLNKDSPGAQFARQLSNRPGSYLQQPSIVRPRSERAAVRVIRTLDSASAPIETRSSLCSWPYLRDWSYWCQ